MPATWSYHGFLCVFRRVATVHRAARISLRARGDTSLKFCNARIRMQQNAATNTDCLSGRKCRHPPFHPHFGNDEPDRNVLDVRSEFQKRILLVAAVSNWQRERASFQFDGSILYFVRFNRVKYSLIGECTLNVIDFVHGSFRRDISL